MIHKVNAKVYANLHNRFDVFRTDILTDKTEQIAYAENILLNQVWTLFPWALHGYSGNSGYLHLAHGIAVGRGTGTLSPTRTGLFSQIFTMTNQTKVFSANHELGYLAETIGVTRTETQDVGEVYSEIGLSAMHDSIYGNKSIISHALLKDMNGNPVTILKKNTEIITFYATLYLYVGTLEFHGGSVYFTSINHSLFRSIIDTAAAAFTKDIIAYNGQPAQGSILKNASIAMHTTLASSCVWTAATKTLKFSGRYAVGDANGNSADFKQYLGIWHFRHSNLNLQLGIPFSREVSGTPWHPSTDIVAEPSQAGDGIRTKFKTKFPYISDVTVKIDGIAALPADFTIDNDVPPAMFCDYLFQYDSAVGAAYNPYYLTHGIKSVYSYSARTLASEDGTNWTIVATGDGTKTIAAQYRNYKYWKSEDNGVYGTDTSRFHEFDMASEDDTANIIFDTPPGLVTEEAVGTGDGSEVDFALDHEPVTGSLIVYINSVETSDYTQVDGIVTFNSAPANGSVITATYRYACVVTVDYTTEVIPKSINHVYDISIEYVFGEYIPA